MTHPLSMPSRLSVLALCGGAVLLGLCPAARAEVRIGPGDVIDIAVARYPDLRIHATVASDGTLDLDEGGAVAVGGLSANDARAAVRRAIAVTAFRRSPSEGRGGVVTVEPDEVTVTVAAYRPVYLSGDVGRPGEVPYRIGMTLRQALAVAGGTGAPKAGLDPRLGVEADVDVRTASLDIALARARIWRVRSALGEADPLDRRELNGLMLKPGVLSVIIDDEAKALKAWRDEGQRARSVADQAATDIDATVATITRQQDEEEKGTAADAEELHALLDLKSRGNVTSTRVNDARRAVLLASTRSLQTQAELLRLKLVRGEVAEGVAHREAERRSAALAELAVANAGLEGARLRLSAAQAKARLLDTAPIDERPTSYVFSLFRTEGRAETRAVIDEATPLEPGDVVEARTAGLGQDGAPSASGGPHGAGGARLAERLDAGGE